MNIERYCDDDTFAIRYAALVMTHCARVSNMSCLTCDSQQLL